MLATILLLLGSQNLLLWRFLDFANPGLYAVGAVLLAVIVVATARATPRVAWPGPSIQTTSLLGIVSVVIYVLGGEVGLFYANADWQVRDAVLHDLTAYPWPFVYQSAPSPDILRAPLGMYVIPSLVGKALGSVAADVALLIQNSLLLTLILALGSTLVERGKGARTLLVLVVFSGMDIAGWLIRTLAMGERIPEHLERWAPRQFSAHITQAFWVPQHALAGWLGALLFLLWQNKRLKLGEMYAFLPLLLFLSPLGTIGMIPFALFAGIVWLLRERRMTDVLLPLPAVLLSIPTILYLGAAWGQVGSRPQMMSVPLYITFEMVEVLPYVVLVALLAKRESDLFSRLSVTAAWLLVVPLVQIAENDDFTMRTSITALALLAFDVALTLDKPAPEGLRSLMRTGLVVALMLGSVTPAAEVGRALYYRPSPATKCNLETAWERIVDLPIFTKTIYLVPAQALPQPVQPRSEPMIAPPDDPRTCWSRPWKSPRWSS